MLRSSLALKLVIRQFQLQPGRAFVTLAGVIASACAVVWVVSGYDALVSQFDENAGKYLGRYDLLLIPQGLPGSVTYADQQMIAQLRADAGIMELNPVHQSRVSVSKVTEGSSSAEETSLRLLLAGKPPVNGAPPIEPVLVGTPATDPPYEMLDGEWLRDNAVVLSSGAAASMNVAVGDLVLITTMANQVKLPVVGIVQQAPENPSLSPSLDGGPVRPRSRAVGRDETGRRGGAGGRIVDSPSDAAPGSGKLPEGRSRFADRMSARLKNVGDDSTNPPLTSIAAGEKSAPAKVRNQAKLGIPAAFVNGVATNAVYVRPEIAERIIGFPAKPTVIQVALRDTIDVAQFTAKWKEPLSSARPPLQIVDFGMVRAGMESSRSVSAQRSQAYVAAGFASLVAMFIIFSLLSMGVSERTREFALLRAVAFSRMQVASIVAVESFNLAVIGWMGGLVAGFFLVWLGSRWMPSMFSNGAELGWTSFWLTGATVMLGAMGAAIVPAWRATRIQPLEALSTSRMEAPQNRTYWIFSIIGLLLSVAAPLSVFVLPIQDDWKVWVYSMVTYPALLIGMGLLAPAIVVGTERLFGRVMATLFGLDGRLLRTQLSSNLWRTIGATLALAVGLGLFVSTQIWGYSMLQPFLPGKWLPDMLVAFQPNGLSAVGVSAVKSVDGVESDQVMPLAVEQAKFDWGELQPPQRIRSDNSVIFGIDPQQAIGGDQALLDLQFIIGQPAAVAKELAGGDTCVISQDFARTSGKTIGDSITFIPPNAEQERVSYRVVGVVDLPGWQWVTKFSGVRRHFVRTSSMMFVDCDALLRDFHLGRPEFCWLNLKPTADVSAVEAGMQRIAEAHSGGMFQADELGEVTSYRPFARSTATSTVTRAITIRASDMIWGMSQLPLITLCIMSLAVVNAMLASVRVRQWEFGILRSVGTTRGQLVRLVFAETVLTGIAASILSLAFGVVAGWCGVGMASYGNWGAFIGEPVFLIPWRQLGFGFIVTLGLCMLAAAWPALRIGRAEPLELLAAGRGAR